MQLTGPQHRRFYDLLLQAFPSYPELERMVFFGLGENLAEIIATTNLRETVYELLKWTRAHDRDGELVAAAVEANGTHQALRAFAIEVGVLTAPKPTDSVPPPSLNEPAYRTLIVDPLRRAGHYTTISAAIMAATPGDRILVRPGNYTERLLLNKPLEIIGDGERAEIVVQANGSNVILFQTSIARVQNLTLRQTGGSSWRATGWFGVDIQQGRLELEDCDIRSTSLACVAIHHGADPRLRRNLIHDGKEGGVYIYNNGQGLLEDNDIFANAFSGVHIKTGGNPTLRRNRIHDGKASGVYINKNGQGLLEDNDITANAGDGVEIRSEGNPTLRGNRIHKNDYWAVWIYSGGAGLFENNDLRDNVRGAWDIDPACLPNVKRSGNIE
ncbi:MAG: right-handed parallel beta-helix repeat-containing protein [Chloroflexota bacterium]|nr:right-handed parallel beta-helix repeat-containing protein [Chloroflexota bacterium]